MDTKRHFATTNVVQRIQIKPEYNWKWFDGEIGKYFVDFLRGMWSIGNTLPVLIFYFSKTEFLFSKEFVLVAEDLEIGFLLFVRVFLCNE